MSPDAGDRAEPEHLVVGHITKAHGTRGELFVHPLTDRPDDVFAPGRQLILGDAEGELTDDAAIVTVETARGFKRGLLVSLEEIATREDAEAVAQRYLLLPVHALPPLDEGELFYHQLLGMRVETVGGDGVGTVREVYDTEPHHLIEIEGDDSRMRLIPFAERIVRSIDPATGVIVIDPPDGLLDL